MNPYNYSFVVKCVHFPQTSVGWRLVITAATGPSSWQRLSWTNYCSFQINHINHTNHGRVEAAPSPGDNTLLLAETFLNMYH